MDNGDDVVAFVLGAILSATLSILLTCDNSDPQTIRAFEKLCKNNVPIVCSTYGNYYLWDERTKSSSEVSKSSVIEMAKNLK